MLTVVVSRFFFVSMSFPCLELQLQWCNGGIRSFLFMKFLSINEALSVVSCLFSQATWIFLAFLAYFQASEDKAKSSLRRLRLRAYVGILPQGSGLSPKTL